MIKFLKKHKNTTLMIGALIIGLLIGSIAYSHTYVKKENWDERWGKVKTWEDIFDLMRERDLSFVEIQPD